MAAKVKQYALPDSIPQWTHVSVQWEDAMGSAGANNSGEFLRDFTPCMRRTSGYVLRYDQEYLIIAGTDDRASGTDQDCEDITAMPIAYVRRITKRR